MALPSAYLTSTKNLAAILDAIQKAQAPERFTQKFLEGLGFTGTADRLVIAVLKAVGFLSDTGVPLPRYHQFLDMTQSAGVLGEGVREAYADLFQINKNAHTMNRLEVKNKMKTLSQGQYSDAVLDKMASTFKALSDKAQFSDASAARVDAVDPMPPITPNGQAPQAPERPAIGVSGLVYSINIHLPESRDPAVYDALFKSLKDHLL